MSAISKPLSGRGTDGRDLREALGAYIRNLREAAGLTQADFARMVDIKHATAISAIETGRNGVPPERYIAFARALNIDHVEFMKEVLRYSNPWAYIALFSDKPDGETKRLNAKLNLRVAP